MVSWDSAAAKSYKMTSESWPWATRVWVIGGPGMNSFSGERWDEMPD